MNDFYVDVRGLNEVYNLLVRASDDARDAYEYALRHCHMSLDQQGLALLIAGPHREAYRRVTDALQQASDLAQSAATQVNLAQGQYARADMNAVARLDASYPGAADPAALRQMLTQSRPDLVPDRPRLSDIAEPTLHLRPPNYVTDITVYQLNPFIDLLSPVAWIRQACVSVLGQDPLENWCTQISGDWDAYVYVSMAWAHVGATAEDIGRNLVAGAPAVSSVWRGNAAEAEQKYQLRLGDAIWALGPVCREYVRLYKEAADAARNFFPPVSDLVARLLDVVILANLAGAAGGALISTGIGAVAGLAVAAFYVAQAIELYRQISSAFGSLENTLTLIAGAIDAIQAGGEVAKVPSLEPYRHPANR